MSRRVVPLGIDNLDHIHPRCRACVRWELSPVAAARAHEAGASAAAKRGWVADRTLAAGTCGQVVYVDDVPAGYLTYAPPWAVPGASAYPTSPASGDSMLLVTGLVVDGYRGSGLGRVLVQATAKELLKRGGTRALEAFGDTAPDSFGCVWPAGFLERVGFAVVREHSRYPRLRLDLRTVLSWRSDVEVALDRLFGAVRGEPVPTPTSRGSLSRR